MVEAKTTGVYALISLFAHGSVCADNGSPELALIGCSIKIVGVLTDLALYHGVYVLAFVAVRDAGTLAIDADA